MTNKAATFVGLIDLIFIDGNIVGVVDVLLECYSGFEYCEV